MRTDISDVHGIIEQIGSVQEVADNELQSTVGAAGHSPWYELAGRWKAVSTSTGHRCNDGGYRHWDRNSGQLPLGPIR